MNDLEQKPGKPDTSWSSHEVTASAAALSEYIDKRGLATPDPLEPASALRYDGSEPLPSMTMSPAVTAPKSYVTTGWVPTIAVALCISLAAREGLLLATSLYSGIGAAVQPATAEAEPSAAMLAALSSSPSPPADVTEESKPQPIAPEQPSLEQGQSWSKAVEAFQRLLAEKTASQSDAWDVRTQ